MRLIAEVSLNWVLIAVNDPLRTGTKNDGVVDLVLPVPIQAGLLVPMCLAEMPSIDVAPT